MQLDLGCHVRTSDDQDIGKIDRIILESRTMTIREFVVHQGTFFRHDRFIPIHFVDRVDPDGVVHLKITAAQASERAEYIGEQHMPIFTGTLLTVPTIHIVTRQGSIPHDAVVLSHRTQVFDSEGKYLGYVDKVHYSDANQVSHIVLDTGDVFLWEMRIPVTSIASNRHDTITLDPDAMKVVAEAS